MPRPGLAIFTHGRFTGVTTPQSKPLSIFTWGKFGAQDLAAALDGDVVEFTFQISQLATVSLAISQRRLDAIELSQLRAGGLVLSQARTDTLQIARVEGVTLEKAGGRGVELER